MSTEELLNTLSRYDSKRKVKSNRRKLLKMKLEKDCSNTKYFKK